MRDDVSDRCDSPDDLVAWHKRKRGHAPLVVNQMEVRMADTAMADRDLHIVRAEQGGGVLVRLKRLFCGPRGVGVYGFRRAGG
jgi:hypothetical protein